MSVNPSEGVQQRVEDLLAAVAGGSRALICTHDNPDPDSIASAFALGKLLEVRAGIPFTLTYGGVLGRAENRAMVRLLKVPLVPITRIDLEEFDVVGLVDTQPEVGNHSLPAEQCVGKRVICIDHHPARLLSKNAAFCDVGGDYGATSTALTAYLEAAKVVPEPSLATALFYGIKSDTRDLGREVSAADVWAYSHLAALTDMSLVSAIEHPRLPRAYFAVLMRAIHRAQITDNVVVVDLGEVYIPDMVPETADRLVQAEGVRWSIVVGEHDGNIYCSIRVNDRRFSAGKLVRELIKQYPEGSAGGHGSMAGMRIPLPFREQPRGARTRARRALLKKLKNELGVPKDARSEPFAPASIADASDLRGANGAQRRDVPSNKRDVAPPADGTVHGAPREETCVPVEPVRKGADVSSPQGPNRA
ncbi:MAG: DHH family phosphoesterase [Myxococcota bacterium]